MPDSKDEKIIAAIVERLKLIDGTGDYQTTLGTDKDGNRNVADSKPNWDEEQNDLPAISVFQGRTETVEAPNARRKVIHTMPVNIRGFIKRETTASNCRAFIADIKRAILNEAAGLPDYLAERWPENGIGLAMETRETASGLEYQQDTFEISAVQVEIEVVFITGKLNPEA